MARSNKASPDGATVTRGAAAGKTFKVPAAGDELIQWLTAKRDQGKPIMAANQMKLNMAFVLGHQWVTWDDRLRSYRRPTVDAADPNAPVRLTSNKIGGIVERTISKLTKNVPNPECRPVSNNDNDVDGARVGTGILAHELYRLHWNSRLQKFLFWPVTVGWGYAHPWWNPEAGAYVGDDAEEGGEEVFEGEVCIDWIAPFDLLVDPSADTMDEARWCIRVTTMSREAAWEKFDVAISGGEPARSLTHEVQALGLVGEDATGNPSQDWVTVYQLWMKPCKAAPQGKVITWAGTEIIENMSFPYDHHELPFIQCDLIPGFSREGRTFVTDLISPQTDYNDSLSREATIRRQLSPKYIGAIGQIDPQRITSRVEVLQYMPGFGDAPHLEMPNAAWAQQFEIGMARNSADMGERAGVSEASRGEAASSAPAASIMALQETDDTKMFISATQLSQFIATAGKQILLLCKQYWKEERTVRVWSDDNMLAAFRYQGADIQSGLDVHVSAESALPRSKAARAQLFLELAQRYPDLFDPQTLMSLLDVPQADLITQSLDIQTRTQHREIAMLLRGEEPEVKGWHDHVIHLKVINDFRCSLDYYNLPMLDQARIDAHAAVHEMLVLKQMGVQIPTPGGPGSPEAAAQAAQVDQGRGGQNTLPEAPGAQGPQQAPAGPSTEELAGIGGPQQPGRVPNMPVDQQAASMGG
jgi:hypothetical protein